MNKPAGLPAHAGRAGGPSAEDWFGALSRRRTGPWLAHRLDTDTAGCLAIALRRAALLEMQARFVAGQVEKIYWATVTGRPDVTSGRIENRIAKRSAAAGWRMVVDPVGQDAVTEWRLLGSGGGMSWLELRPRTGRTHQIRVHCAQLGCPVAGDAVYGKAPGGRLQLLARSLDLKLTPAAAATAPVPAHMHEALALCGWDGAG